MVAGIKLNEVTLTGNDVYDCRLPLSPLPAIRVLLRIENLILVRIQYINNLQDLLKNKIKLFPDTLKSIGNAAKSICTGRGFRSYNP